MLLNNVRKKTEQKLRGVFPWVEINQQLGLTGSSLQLGETIKVIVERESKFSFFIRRIFLNGAYPIDRISLKG